MIEFKDSKSNRLALMEKVSNFVNFLQGMEKGMTSLLFGLLRLIALLAQWQSVGLIITGA